jgi:methionine-R-sulfoxide reductase
MLKWTDVYSFARKGNPVPDRRDERSDAEWQTLLTPQQFQIARLKGTERPFSGHYCESHEPGKYACICCGTLLFDANLKFDSGTGWPSFTQPEKVNAIAYHLDKSFGMERVEVCCNTCDAHLGHVFPDGPAPGGLRYCINALAIRLVED